MIPKIDAEFCTGCQRCQEVCPPRAIVVEDGHARVDEEFCEECGVCAAACPVRAIEVPFPKSG